MGRKIDFKNTVIIMTSNIGARQLKDFGEGVGFATASRIQNADENNKAVIEKALKRTFSPEFLNRIDDVVIFNSLTKENIFEIIDILMKGVMKRLVNLGFTMELTAQAKDFIAEKGYDSAIWCKAITQGHSEIPGRSFSGRDIKYAGKEGDTPGGRFRREKGKN
jgi:ATP-dependent Clp protease ATP-binding subunit ClpC